MAQVYALRINSTVSELRYRQLINKIDERKRAKVEKFVKSDDALRCLFADLLVRYLFIQHYSLRNEDIIFSYGDYGKPSLAALENLHYNISHSGEWIVCAIDDKPVGVDIERIAAVDLEIAEHYFSDEEKIQLFALPLPEQTVFFFDLWTLKESYLKQNGKGLFLPLDAFTIVVDRQENISLESDAEIRESIFFKQYNIDADYKMAVCTSSNSFEPVELINMGDVADFFG